MTTYTWLIEALDCVPSTEGKANVVNNIHWRVNATDGTNNATIYGAQGVAFDPKAPFIAYNKLTKDMAIQWVQEAMGIDAVTRLQEALDKQLEGLNTPTVVTLPLPW
jgi:hypothetical protein